MEAPRFDFRAVAGEFREVSDNCSDLNGFCMYPDKKHNDFGRGSMGLLRLCGLDGFPHGRGQVSCAFQLIFVDVGCQH